MLRASAGAGSRGPSRGPQSSAVRPEQDSGTPICHCDGLDFLDRPHRHTGECFELRRALEAEVRLAALNLRLSARSRILVLVEFCLYLAVILRANGRFPLAVIKAGLRPAGCLLPRVKTFAHEKIRLLNWPRPCHLPRGRSEVRR